MTSADPQTRYEVEELFFKEAALLDEWRLEEWLELLTEDATYHVPPLMLVTGMRELRYLLLPTTLRGSVRE